jgi:hypothetical protein
MILRGSLELKKKKFLLALFKIQNGGEIQDGRQTINVPDLSKRMQIICNFGF